jgi:hypothetical protein
MDPRCAQPKTHQGRDAGGWAVIDGQRSSSDGVACPADIGPCPRDAISKSEHYIARKRNIASRVTSSCKAEAGSVKCAYFLYVATKAGCTIQPVGVSATAALNSETCPKPAFPSFRGLCLWDTASKSTPPLLRITLVGNTGSHRSWFESHDGISREGTATKARQAPVGQWRVSGELPRRLGVTLATLASGSPD